MEREMDYKHIFAEDDPNMQFLKAVGGRIARIKEVLITNITVPRMYERLPQVVFFDRKDEQRALDWQPYVVIGTNKMFTYQGFLKAPQGIVVYGSEIFEALKAKIVTGRLKPNRYHRKPSLKLFLLEVPDYAFTFCMDNDYRTSELFYMIMFQLMRHANESYWKSCEADILQLVNRCVYRCGADVQTINFRLNEKLFLDHEGEATFEPRDAFLLLACQQPELVNEVIKYARINQQYVDRLTNEEFNTMREYPWVVPPFARLIRRYLPVDIIAGFRVFNTRLRLDNPDNQIKEMIRASRTQREANGFTIDYIPEMNRYYRNF